MDRPGSQILTWKKATGKETLGHAAQALILAFMVFLLVFWRGKPQMNTLGLVFSGIVLEALPFMVIGAIVGGLIEEFVSPHFVSSLARRKVTGAIVGAALGIIFPVCECAVIPVARRLLKKGMPLSAGIAYLVGGPIVNPVVAVSTLAAYGFDFRVMWWRMSLGYVVAVLIGSIFGILYDRRLPLAAAADDPPSCCDHHHGEEKEEALLRQRVRRAFGHGASDFLSVAHFLIIGAFFAGLMQVLVARRELLFLSASPLWSIPAMMACAVLLNLCSETDAFIAASFRSIVPFHLQMVFMLLGPMLDLKLFSMYLGLMRTRPLLTLCALILGLVALAGLFLRAVG
ncbi:MAG: putative permease [Syntrophorhabdaceae bacterium PtaU1.Bin034]|nr:MAG: putative permease [Syntrophorhabdaceae bacterium PtaU1.Bin034]